ncbi:DeoR/GlpR family DNA-binding transcription regulator [Pararhizobium antarcticum]|uniref:DeoR family transcriptional regulator n=1 Tax=Pararhizobium antarcticum TaxID=1798805 RepID=A0A657LP58_9HYPH|nr:DeoR/GlpR family DNA-binding transcription regulator [Pararhizobium antarcticum]OJF92425.1 DeoR family transcriptional regulator [Pararhizobium antarcticum]OJF99116.1 DeoR family transcriptional regulator [Rhizobium sp. 58]
MLTSQRRALITARLASDGQLVAKALADELDLSEDTIRRDLRDMAAEGLLQRVHGGALPLQPPLPDFPARQTMAGTAKRDLGKMAAGLIRPGQLVFLDGGTTNAEIARALPRNLAVTIATHSPTIAAELVRHAADVILIGGRLYKHSMVATGATTLAAIEAMRPDIFFMGVTALHPAHGLSTGDFEEAAIKRAIAAQAAETFVCATNEKFGATSPHRIMPVERLAGLIVQQDIDEQTLAPYRDMALQMIAA